MDTVFFIDILTNVLVGVCALLAAASVLFLVVRPLLDPHWKDGQASSTGPQEGEARGSVETGGMQGT